MTATSLEVMFDALAGASIAGAVVAAGVWALSAAIGRLPAAVRCTLWWLVALKLLVGLTSIEPVAVPILPSATAATSALSAPAAVTRAATQSAEEPIARTLTWRAALMVIWLGGLVVAAALAIGQWRRISSIRAGAHTADAGLTSGLRELSERSGLSAAPDVRFSPRDRRADGHRADAARGHPAVATLVLANGAAAADGHLPRARAPAPPRFVAGPGAVAGGAPLLLPPVGALGGARIRRRA